MPLPSRKRHTKHATSLPKDFLTTVGDLFRKQFAKQLHGSTFLMYGELHPDEVILSICLNHPKSLAAACLHLSMDPAKDSATNPEKVTEQLKAMVDVAASWFAQGLEAGTGIDAVLSEMRDASPAWQEIDWEGQKIFVKLSRDNYALEGAADKLLKEAGFDTAEDELADDFGDDDEGSRGPLQ